MSEGAMWAETRPLLSGLDPVRIESPMTELGIPDVNYVFGWMELKYAPRWPKREETPLRIPHYTKEQRAWAISRAAHGGKVFLLLKVGDDEWLLFKGSIAAQVVGNLPRAELYRETLARWTRKPKKMELQQWLT